MLEFAREWGEKFIRNFQGSLSLLASTAIFLGIIGAVVIVVIFIFIFILGVATGEWGDLLLGSVGGRSLQTVVSCHGRK